MTRATCHAALGLGCMATAAAPPAHAAEWSLAPTLTVGIDNDSNRLLIPDATADQSWWLFSNVQLQRATDTTQLSITPQVRWQHFDSEALGDIVDRDLSGAFSWTQERGSFSLSAATLDDSTVTTELTETGIASGDSHRRTEEASVSESFDETERSALVLQAGYTDVSYYGTLTGELGLLEGYRYPTASVGERFFLSSQTSLTASAFADELLARISVNDSRETGGQLELTHTFSDSTQIDVSAGASARTLRTEIVSNQGFSLGSESSTGTVASADITHAVELGKITLSYSRQLVPYGTGVLAERQQYQLLGAYHLTEKVGLDASVLRSVNNQSIVLLGLGRRSYTGTTLGLDWRPLDAWKLRAEADTMQSQTIGTVSLPVSGWRVALTLTWAPPYPYARSF